MSKSYREIATIIGDKLEQERSERDRLAFEISELSEEELLYSDLDALHDGAGFRVMRLKSMLRDLKLMGDICER